MSKTKYAVNITLECDLIEADSREHLEEIINKYIDNLAKQDDESITWSSVDWNVVYASQGEEIK